jgi:dTDP-4-amino-4,6-dideoxyglucose
MTFDPPLHVGKPASLDRVVLSSYTDRIHASSRFTNDGPLVREFEEAVAEEAGTQHAVAVSSGTAALQVLFTASGLYQARVSAFTFPGVLGMAPPDRVQVVDCSPAGNIAADLPFSDHFTLAQHLWGALDATPIKVRDAYLYYDAAHAMGARLGGRRCGTFGLASILSFHATKIVTSGEGGAVVTNDGGLAETCREIRNFGFQSPSGAVESPVVRWGMNAKMSEFAAAVGLTSLQQLPRAIEENDHCREAYQEGLRSAPVSILDMPPGSNKHYFVIVMEEGKRDALMEALHAEGVLARRYFHPGLHRQPALNCMASSFPVADRLASTLLCLPTGPAVGVKNCFKVAEIICRFMETP